MNNYLCEKLNFDLCSYSFEYDLDCSWCPLNCVIEEPSNTNSYLYLMEIKERIDKAIDLL